MIDDLKVSIGHREFSKSQHATFVIDIVLSLIGEHKRFRIPGPEGLHKSITFNLDRRHETLDSWWWQHTARIQKNVVSLDRYAAIALKVDELGKILPKQMQERLKRDMSGAHFVDVESDLTVRRHIQPSFDFKWKVKALVHHAP